MLSPGTYNEVDLRKGAFTSVSGLYAINKFRADNGGVINIDLPDPLGDVSGEITIYVRQRLDLFRDTNVSMTEGGAADLTP